MDNSPRPSNGRGGGLSSSSSSAKDTKGTGRNGAEGKKRRHQSNVEDASAHERGSSVSSQPPVRVSSPSRPAAASSSSKSERRADQSVLSSDNNRSPLSSTSIPKKKRKISNASDQGDVADLGQEMSSPIYMYIEKKKKKKRKLLTTEVEASTGGSPSVASATAFSSPSRAQVAAQKGNKSLSAVEMALARLEARSSSATKASSDERIKPKSKSEAKTKSALLAAATKESSTSLGQGIPQDAVKQPNASEGARTAKIKKKKKKKKRHSPFRVRVGCIVALRYQSGGMGNNNNIVKRVGTSNGNDADNSDNMAPAQFVEIWADPQPGQDNGLALIGRRIRCIFPKWMCGTTASPPSSRPTSPTKSGSRSNSPVPRSNRTLEGEVVAILDRKRGGGRGNGGSSTTTVSLLIDQSVAKEYDDFLPIDTVASGTVDTASDISSTEKKRMEMERKIRGEGKVAVQVSLADDAGSSGSANRSKRGARWVIRKRIPAPAAIESTKATSNSSLGKMFVGDGNDSVAQQQQNWRWLASSSAFSASASASASGPCAGILIGEVIKVEPSADVVDAGTLAAVTIRRVWLPEHTLSGRLAHHGPMELFDVENAGGVRADEAVLYEVPIEDLVILGRHVDRTSTPEQNSNEHFQVVRNYSATDNCFTNADGVGAQSSAVCHRCRISFDSASMFQCSSDACQCKSTLWCKSCINQMQPASLVANAGTFELANAANWQCWIGPCCTGLCKCPACLECSIKMMIDTERLHDICSICARPCADGPVRCKKCLRTSHLDCAAWERALRHTAEKGAFPSNILCALGKADGGTEIKCRACRDKKKQKKAEKMNQGDDSSGDDPFKNLSRLIASANPSDFEIPASFGTASKNELSFEPFVRAPKKKLPKSTPLSMPVKSGDETADYAGSSKQNERAKSPANIRKKASTPTVPSARIIKPTDMEVPEAALFKPTCSRTLQYDPTKKDINALHSFDPLDDVNGRVHISRRRTDAEDVGVSSTKLVETKKANSRAARASQRRMLRDVASFGASGLGVDTLAGRDKEQSIRFGRSGIHAWGVFADEKISKGDMIVEYRGVLISNRVAEKREKEYEKSKVGSDYMFRIDSEVVCDATYQGNVARFINASCEPNCFTKIVTIDGTKRIVIFAKRNIKPGEELVYDYMFPLEYNEKKRIPCHCGSAKCKGFMNWDNRYVVIPPKEKSEDDQ